MTIALSGARVLAPLILAGAVAASGAAARPADDGAAAADIAPAQAAAPKPLADVLAELDAILLAGESLPPDFGPMLAPLPPAERLLAVAYARRAGLLTGPALPLDALLAGSRR